MIDFQGFPHHSMQRNQLGAAILSGWKHDRD